MLHTQTESTAREGLLSIVLLSYHSGEKLVQVTDAVQKVMQNEGIRFELIIIDDGSGDDSFRIAELLEQAHPFVRAYRLSRNYTSPYAQFAGYSLALGDCAVSIPDDLQRPLDTVVAMYRRWQQGHPLVISYRRSRKDGLISDWFSNNYYRFMNRYSDVRFPPGGTDGFLADREIIDILTRQISPRNTSIIIEVLRLGFEPVFLPFDRPQATGKSRWTWKKKVRLAKDTFFASSSFPIRMISMLGFMTFAGCMLLVPILVYAKLFTDNSLFGFQIPGWTTIVIFLTMFSGLNLLALGIVSEYVWRIYEEVKGRPGYIIRQKEGDHA